MEKVRNQPCMTFVGVPGSGKSATAHHIALKLQEEGYEVVPVDEIREIKQYRDTKNPQVFVIDDVVGVFGLQKTKLDVLTDYEQRTIQPCMVKSRTLMTCRETVFNESLPYKPFLIKEETVIKLHSSDHALDGNDKIQILQKYGLNVNIISPAMLTSTSRMFPLLCKLFSKEPKFQALGSEFFINPIQCIIDELDDMQRQNRLNYVTLVLCMLNGNCLSKDVLKDRQNQYFMNMKTDTLENCELESHTDAFKFVNALSIMEGTYTKQCGAKYTFIHDSLFEICAYQYGKQFPDQMLQYMSSIYIANYVKPQTSETGIAKKVKEKQSNSQSIEEDKSSVDSDIKGQNENASDDENSKREESSDLCIRLREDQYPLLTERLYRDIQNMELYDVFRNQVLKHPQVCQAFIGVLKTKSYTELKSVFLSSQGNIDKILSKQECLVEESEGWSEWRIQGVVVDKRNKLDDKGEAYEEYNVRVISWVTNYGHYQILEYIVQQTEQHKEVSELFGITGNSPQESRSEIFEKNIVFNKSRREGMIERFGIDACNNQDNDRPVEQSTSEIYTCNEQESEINRLVEQCRLLALSCYSGDVQTVRVLLPICNKAITGIGQVSEDIQWYSPLNAACEIGHVSIVDELVKVGADVNLQDIWGDTPLIAACEGGHVGVVEELVKVGADVNVKGRWGNNTPLLTACKGGHVSIVEELVKAGADVNLQKNYGNTPLIAALEELVKAGADVNLQNNYGNTPLIAACEGEHVSIVEELVKAGADVNLQNNYGNTPLIAALKELTKAGANINLQNYNGNTPLIDACQRGHVSIVEELVKAGADVNVQGRWGNNTPLIAACEGGHVSIVEELAKVGADVNQKNKLGNVTPLIAACIRGHVSIVEELVKAGADVNLQNSQENTPMIAAVRNCSLSTVKCLVEHGADWVTKVVDINVSAVYKALILNKPDIVKYLIQEQNKITPGTLNGNVHLFNCLVDIRHAGVKTDSRDDVVVTDRSVWCMDRGGDLWATISEEDCDVLRHLLCVGLDVNQSIHLYDKYKDKSDVRPLLYTLIDVHYHNNREKVIMLLWEGADVNVRMSKCESVLYSLRCREYDSVLDRECVSVLERTRRLVCKYGEYSRTDYKRVLCEIKKHVRRHSV
ncbi:uncharacterized protein LOC130046588 [Ostrea edulis]|uniref:uncharacterized protein LOC130046588 n=1 Tax=Ostrea edulis TaxID=37623 RepID=UPI0024AF7F91|nr:uncharacterized protein LOC130046588 [Ostrea edulis]